MALRHQDADHLSLASLVVVILSLGTRQSSRWPRNSGVGILDIRLRNSGDGVLESEFWSWNSGVGIPKSEFMTSDFGIPELEFRIWNSGTRIQESEFGSSHYFWLLLVFFLMISRTLKISNPKSLLATLVGVRPDHF